MRLYVLGANKDTVTGAEADNDEWDAEEEGLEVELEQLPGRGGRIRLAHVVLFGRREVCRDDEHHERRAS